MFKLTEQETLQLKFGLAIKKILENNKKLSAKGKGLKIDDSYSKISSSTGLRSASISYIISGKSNLKISTLNLLLEALNKTYTDFGIIIDSITQEEINKYYKEIKGIK